MTYAEAINKYAMTTPNDRVRKVGKVWLASDFVTGEDCPMCYKTKKEALAWATRNAQVALDRLKEEARTGRTMSSIVLRAMCGGMGLTMTPDGDDDIRITGHGEDFVAVRNGTGYEIQDPDVFARVRDKIRAELNKESV